MKNTIYMVIFLFTLLQTHCSPVNLLQFLSVTAPECNYHGNLYKGKCYCDAQWTGPLCSLKDTESIYDTDDKCDDLVSRLDNLDNISPEHYDQDDDEFSRFNGDSVGPGAAAYGDKGNTWIKMHDVASNFNVLSDEVSATDIHQGALGDCYMLAAFGSLSNIDNGYYIRNVFETLEDNPKHVYVTRWFYGGKILFVAVDEWIPGINNEPFFSKVSKDYDFWPIILEKAWAKIHGTYMATQYGIHTEVWSALLGAPSFQIEHGNLSGDYLWNFIKELLGKGYAVGGATSLIPSTKEVPAHAYSVLGTYEIQLDNNTQQKLILYHNPWSQDVWNENPWGDYSPNWTTKVKAQLPMYRQNSFDGLTFVTPEDFAQNFGVTNWVEVRKDYEVVWLDVAFQKNQSAFHLIKFRVNSSGEDVYIFVEQPTTRLLLGCSSYFTVDNLQVGRPNGGILTGDSSVKIDNAESGEYVLMLNAVPNKDWAKYFTVSCYAPQNSVIFEQIANNEIVYNEKKCPNDCNGHGRCNTFKGECSCYWSYSGDDCSVYGQIGQTFLEMDRRRKEIAQCPEMIREKYEQENIYLV